MPTSVPPTKELAHIVTDVEVLDVSGKTFPRHGAVVEGERDVLHRPMVHPAEEKVEGRRVGDMEEDDGVGVGGREELGRSSREGGFRRRGGSRTAEETS